MHIGLDLLISILAVAVTLFLLLIQIVSFIRFFFRINLEQIEKRRAEVNEEMAEIVNRFEAATESLHPTLSDSHNNSSIQNNSLLEQSTIDKIAYKTQN